MSRSIRFRALGTMPSVLRQWTIEQKTGQGRSVGKWRGGKAVGGMSSAAQAQTQRRRGMKAIAKIAK